MLWKNGVKFDLDSDIKKEIKERFKGRFPLRFVFPKEKVRINPKDPNRPHMPHKVWIPFNCIVNTKGGIEEWHYTRTMPRSDNGRYNFKSDGIFFDGKMSLDELNIEAIYYFLYICPLCKTSKTAGQAKVHYMELYDRRSISNDFVEKEKSEAAIKYMILEKHTKERIIRLCKACHIDDVDGMEDNEMRMLLYQVVKLDPAKLALVMNEDENVDAINMRVLIQDGNEKVIRYVQKKRRWYWVTTDGTLGDEICIIPPNKNFTDAIVNHFTENINDYKILKAALGVDKTPK